MPNQSGKAREQIAAEADVERFRKDLGPFVASAEATRMAMVFTNAKKHGNPIVFANQAFLELTGWTRDEVLGVDFNCLMARGASAQALKQIDQAVGGHSSNDPEVCYRRKDGSEFWASIFISPVKDEQGRIVQHFASFIDLTRHKAEQAHSTMLIDELNHRVKNTLSTVQSIINQALQTATDPAVIRELIESRIFALSRSHDLLSRDNWRGAGLHDLIDQALEPFAVAGDRPERFRIAGDNRLLEPKATLALAIAIHELATNAHKYGAFSNDGGSVAIGWAVKDTPAGERIVLQWRETNGPPVNPPSHKGFGSQVLERGLAHELSGDVVLDYRPTGVECTISMPTANAARDKTAASGL